MTLFRKKILDFWHSFVYLTQTVIIAIFHFNRVNQEGLLVDVSTYFPPYKTLVQIRHNFFRFLSWTLALLIGYFLNEKMVYKDEPDQTFQNINQILGFAFILFGALTYIILILLLPIQSRWKGLISLEKTIQTTGLFILFSGISFILLGLSKFYFLFFAPRVFFVYYLTIWKFTLFWVQGFFFIGFGLCFYVVFIRIYRLLFFYDRLLHPREMV